MDPVDEEVGEEEKERELKIVVEGERCLSGGVVQLCIAPYLRCEEGSGQNCHYGHRRHCLLHLKSNLVLEVLRVLEGIVVEYEEVGEGCADVIHDKAEDPAAKVSLGVKLIELTKLTTLSRTSLWPVCKCCPEAMRCGMPNLTAGSSLFSTQVGRSIEESSLRLLSGLRMWRTGHADWPVWPWRAQMLAK